MSLWTIVNEPGQEGSRDRKRGMNGKNVENFVVCTVAYIPKPVRPRFGPRLPW